ncbi:GNAT family N-acetyltransferase [Gordonia sp. TBRC 11910]|uniref:GNAT family N-acetyltransferase n=1 Tax=Gordonia asplenii TaxID=2725283 RepID=A0A848L4D8_9ACTN|nr:GNAT family N-acetyltransferase [Gordonia asplenii]
MEVLVVGDEVVGVLVSRVDRAHLFVENVAIAPSARGRGYGRSLLAHAQSHAADAGLGGVRLYTNAAMTENLELYRHLGYVEVDRRHVDGFDRVFFEKTVES